MANMDDDITTGSGSVYADLGLADAEELGRKATLVMALSQQIAHLGLSQRQAAERTGIPQPKLSDVLRGKFRGVSETRLLEALAALGSDIEIVIHPPHADASPGRLAVTLAAE